MDKIGKETIQSILLVGTIILVGVASFGLGRISVVDTPTYSIQTPVNAQNTAQPQGNEVIASKNGSKWHYLHCPGAKQISEKNKISFASVQIAESAGYTKALNCE